MRHRARRIRTRGHPALGLGDAVAAGLLARGPCFASAFPGYSPVACWTRATAYSCGGSRGVGARLRRTAFPLASSVPRNHHTSPLSQSATARKDVDAPAKPGHDAESVVGAHGRFPLRTRRCRRLPLTKPRDCHFSRIVMAAVQPGSPRCTGPLGRRLPFKASNPQTFRACRGCRRQPRRFPKVRKFPPARALGRRRSRDTARTPGSLPRA